MIRSPRTICDRWQTGTLSSSVFLLEYGAMDVDACSRASKTPRRCRALVWADANGNGVDDGWETQSQHLSGAPQHNRCESWRGSRCAFA